jgi:anti-anti-sigma regulatory factor
MVFSLFKKSDEKMPTRPAAKPRAPASGSVPASAPAAGDPQSVPPAARGELSQPPVSFDDDLESLDFTGIQIAEALDPLDAALEQAAIDFANDDDASAAAVLGEQLQIAESSPKSERVWLMLFDLHRVTGNREAFTALEMDYARRFEKQPPVWREAGAETVAAARGGAATPFKGELVGSNAAGFAQLQQLFTGNPKARVDFAKIKAVDAAGCEQLLAFLALVRKKKGTIELVGLESLSALLAARIAEQAGEQAYWRTLLECYQRLGRQEEFDNLAVDFAVAFEISPPSWDPVAAPAKPAAAAKPVAAKAPELASSDGFPLRGDIRGGRLDGLDAYLAGHEAAVIDMAGVTRMDFTSAGGMLNILTPHWQRGLSITLRHPNRLVAELLHVVGVSAMVTIVYAKS